MRGLQLYFNYKNPLFHPSAIAYQAYIESHLRSGIGPALSESKSEKLPHSLTGNDDALWTDVEVNEMLDVMKVVETFGNLRATSEQGYGCVQNIAFLISSQYMVNIISSQYMVNTKDRC